MQKTTQNDYLAALEKQHSWITSLIQDATLAIAGSTPQEPEQMWDGIDDSEREVVHLDFFL